MLSLANSTWHKCGDLNSEPFTKIMHLLISHGQLHDTWAVLNPRSDRASGPAEAIRLNGITCDSPVNSYSAGKDIRGQALLDYGKRLDYILFRPASPAPALMIGSERLTLVPQDCRVALSDKIPGRNFSFSDHFGVQATFRFSPPSSDIEARQAHPQLPTIASLSADTFAHVIQNLQGHIRQSRNESESYLTVFAACVIIGCLLLPVGASFQPLQYLNWLFVLAGVACGALGASAFSYLVDSLFL